MCRICITFGFVRGLFSKIFRETDQTNLYFVQQRRKGYGKSKGFSSLVVGTMDSVFDTKPAPFRILHQTPNSEVYHRNIKKSFGFISVKGWLKSGLCFGFLVIASALTEKDIEKDWAWLIENVSPVLHSIENEDEITRFVCGKIRSIIATRQESITEGFSFYFTS